MKELKRQEKEIKRQRKQVDFRKKDVYNKCEYLPVHDTNQASLPAVKQCGCFKATIKLKAKGLITGR